MTFQQIPLECSRHAGQPIVDCPKCSRLESRKIDLKLKKSNDKREHDKNSRYLSKLIDLDYEARFNKISDKRVAAMTVFRSKMSDYKHNDTCKNIVLWCKLHNCPAKMVEVKGTWIPPAKVHTMAGERTIGTGYFRRSNAIKGNSDVEFEINGIGTYYCEIKKFGDTQKNDQKAFQKKVESEGKVYFIVHSLDEFVDYFKILFPF